MALARCLALVTQVEGAAFMLYGFVSPAGVVHHAQHGAAEIAPA